MKDFITQNKYKKIFIVIFWICIWQIIALFVNKGRAFHYLPYPIEAIKTLYNLFFIKDFYISVKASIFRVFIGFFLSCFFGIIIGYICGIYSFAYELFQPLIITMRATPVVSIIIIALLWFKTDNVPIFASLLMCFPIMWTNVVEGIRNTDKKLIEMCKIYNIRKIRIFTSVHLYSALPYIISGMNSSLGIGWKASVAAEVLSFPKYSIGEHLYNSKVYLEPASLFAWTIVIILLSFIFEKILRKIFMRIQNY